MSIFVIADLHLSFKNPKPMDIFGDNWTKHEEKIKKDWNEKVKEEVDVKQRKTNKKKKHTGLKIFIIILIVLGICGGIFAKKVYDLDGNWLAALFGHNKETLKNLDKLEVLVMGESTGSSDTMIVCSYDPKTQKASMLSIPRDTFIGDNTKKARPGNKLNSFYSNGSTPEKTIEAINKVTGLNLKYYILIDTKALKELVNIVGDVEFNVPIDMDYDDETQDLHIHLKEGLQKLNGDKVEQVVRFRHNNDGSTYSYKYGIEDYGRMKTQRELIKTVLKQTIQFKNIKEIGKIMDLAKDYVQTNMEFSNLKDYIPYIVNLDVDSIQAEHLPGESKMLNGIWFFLNDKEETKEKKKTEKSEKAVKKKAKKDKKDEKIEELNDRLMRNLAEFENFRNRSEKEKSAMFEIGAKSVVEKMLPVVDNLERGFDGLSDEEKETPFAKGIEAVYKQLLTGLEEIGVTPIEAVGKEFDPNFHNAVMHDEDDSDASNQVIEEFQKGYMYKDSVVRHSMVKVLN